MTLNCEIVEVLAPPPWPEVGRAIKDGEAHLSLVVGCKTCKNLSYVV
jgi:hypothetical protein